MLLLETNEDVKYLDVTLDFKFMGGSMGCAETRKIVMSCEYAIEHKIPIVFKASSGGIRM